MRKNKEKSTWQGDFWETSFQLAPGVYHYRLKVHLDFGEEVVAKKTIDEVNGDTAVIDWLSRDIEVNVISIL